MEKGGGGTPQNLGGGGRKGDREIERKRVGNG